MVVGILVPHLHRLVADRIAQPDRRAAPAWPETGLEALLHPPDDRLLLHEIAPLRELTPTVPVTTNFMGLFPGLNYPEFAEHVDVVSWDSYPVWHTTPSDWRLAVQISFIHDQNRSMKGGKPFMLMESTPSNTNWQPIPKLKRPGMHTLSSAAGGGTWLRYRTVFPVAQEPRRLREIPRSSGRSHWQRAHPHFPGCGGTGSNSQKLDPIVGTSVQPQVGIIYDWENRWAIDNMEALGNDRRNYPETVIATTSRSGSAASRWM